MLKGMGDELTKKYPRPIPGVVGSGWAPQTGNRTQVDRAEKVIDLLAQGSTLRKALEDVGLTASQLHRVINTIVPSLKQRYIQAMEIRADLWADQTVEIADDNSLDYNVARNRIQARQWVISKQSPRMYGDRMEMQFSGSVSVSEALALARARVGRQSTIIDAETVEPETLAAAPELPTLGDNVDDIFS